MTNYCFTTLVDRGSGNNQQPTSHRAIPQRTPKLIRQALSHLRSGRYSLSAYERLADFMLIGRRDKYHPLTYLQQLIGLQADRSTAEVLGQDVHDLQTCYERARTRVKAIDNHDSPIIPILYWGFCYVQALRDVPGFALDCQRQELNPKDPDFLTRAIAVAGDAEKHLHSTGNDSQGPLSCAAVSSRQPYDGQTGEIVADITPPHTPRSPRTPPPTICGFCGKRGHSHTVCNRFKAFCATRPWATLVYPKCLLRGHPLASCTRAQGKQWQNDASAWRLLLGQPTNG
ncbi:hypothetical protein Efla_002509 [Eimeria flavescens]